ncbi:MAG: M48 family metallopeptidase [Planctomycetota bacterium]|jgi:predicted Zn-dependent protease
MRRLLPLFLLALVAGCQTNPRTGRSQYILLSEEHMVDLGEQAYAEMTTTGQVKISNDPALTAPLHRVGKAISEAADKPDYEWEFKLIDDPEMVNAWALPGGKIAFYTGIYPVVQDEAGMAVVMGHEVMHAVLRHSNERMSQNLTAQLVMAGAAVGLKDHKYRGEILGAMGVGASLGIILPYSRTHETEADEYGLYLAAKAGYNPEAAIGVWQRMAERSKGGRPPEFLSTHPDPLRRIENMKQWLPKAMDIYAQSQQQPNPPLPKIK